MEITKEKVFDAALRILTYRANSYHELKTKLAKKEYPEDMIQFALSECERLRFVDDVEFARMYCEDLKSRNYGLRKIQMYMKKKGLDSELINQTMEECDSDDEQLERASVALQRKMRSLVREKDPWKKREKAYRFLVSRGFSSFLVSRVIEQADFT